MSHRREDPKREQQIPRPGDVIAGKYRVERMLGRGGMGMVVAARHLMLGERVALKLLLPDGEVDPTNVERFLHEARASRRIVSEHVARVTDVGTLETGAPFMVMELLEGEDLGSVIRARRKLPVDEAVDYVLQACDALARAHDLGIVHRDIKPANLFLTRRPDGTPLIKVLDFGISKSLDQGAVSLTLTTDMLGSPLYMSPEQIRSPKEVDTRTDLWSLGAILFKLLSGVEPFSGQMPSTVLAKIVADPPADIRALRPDLPRELEEVVLSCLEKNPARRVQSIEALARALAPFAGDPRKLGEIIDRTAPGASVSRANRPTLQRSRRFKRLIPVGAAVGAVVLGGTLAAFVFVHRPHASTQVSSEAPPPALSASVAALTAPTVSAAAIEPTAPASASAAPIVSASRPLAKQPGGMGAEPPSWTRVDAGPRRSFTGALDDRF